MSDQTRKRLILMFNMMLDHFGHQSWWPGESALEIMAGAILTQNTRWHNVEKAIVNLKNNKLLSLKALHCISTEDLAEKIRPAGYYNLKAARLKNLITALMENYEGKIENLLKEDTSIMREFLLSVKGVGPETADSIILYAADRPVFVVDAYTYRILSRHDMADESMGYDELQELFVSSLPEDSNMFNEFHALVVLTGKEFCGRKPKCEICPLKNWEREPDNQVFYDV